MSANKLDILRELLAGNFIDISALCGPVVRVKMCEGIICPTCIFDDFNNRNGVNMGKKYKKNLSIILTNMIEKGNTRIFCETLMNADICTKYSCTECPFMDAESLREVVNIIKLEDIIDG